MLLKEKEIKQSFNVLGIAYCDLQYLLRFYYRIGYTAGTYGWKADYYQIDNSNFMLSTGYSPLQTVKIDDKIKRSIIYDFNEAAKKNKY